MGYRMIIQYDTINGCNVMELKLCSGGSFGKDFFEKYKRGILTFCGVLNYLTTRSQGQRVGANLKHWPIPFLGVNIHTMTSFKLLT